MKIVLYDEELGYYANGPKIGKKGDFFTSVSVGSCFGTLLSLQVEEVWEKLGRPETFSLVEQGANDGQLAFDLLSALKKRGSPLFLKVNYQIIEPLLQMQDRQRVILQDFGEQLQILNSVDDLEPITGVMLSNELVDAFPVHRVVFQETWKELCVVEDGGDFKLEPTEIKNAELRVFLSSLGTDFPDGYSTEVNLAAGPWLKSLAEKLERGVLLTIDYGYLRDEYYRLDRYEGTFRTFFEHQASDDPFAHPGDCDLTAHVDFTTLAEAAREAGMDVLGLVDQNRFLVGVGEQWLRESEKGGGLEPSVLRQFQTLTHPTMMGRVFRVFGAARDEPFTDLSGFRYAGSV